MVSTSCLDCGAFFLNVGRGSNKRKRCSSCQGVADLLANKKSVKKQYDKHRTAVLNHYGDKCACCGETRIEFLAVDHINGGGKQQRKEAGGSGRHFYRWVVLNNFPDWLRLLCHNCNLAHGFYGYCPHDKERKDGFDSRTDANDQQRT